MYGYVLLGSCENFGLGNDLVLSGNKPWLEPMLTRINEEKLHHRVGALGVGGGGGGGGVWV